MIYLAPRYGASGAALGWAIVIRRSRFGSRCFAAGAAASDPSALTICRMRMPSQAARAPSALRCEDVRFSGGERGAEAPAPMTRIAHR